MNLLTNMTLWKFLYCLTLTLIPVIITQRKTPSSALAWMMSIILLPFLGPLLYLFFGTQRIRNRGLKKLFSNKKVTNRLRKIENDWSPTRKQQKGGNVSPEWEPIIQVCKTRSLFDAVTDNHIEILTDIKTTYELMEEAIKSAKHHIHLNYYIFLPDTVGKRFAELLIEQAQKGIKVRLLYDAIGSHKLVMNWLLINRLRKGGVKIDRFLPLRAFLKPWRLNLRNHRKILVVDNRIGFTGSLNIGKTFLSNKKNRWRETSILVQGPAVAQLQWIFCEDWFSATGEMITFEEYFKLPDQHGNETVQVVAGGPDERERAVFMAFFMAISQAKKSIYITTPYFFVQFEF